MAAMLGPPCTCIKITITISCVFEVAVSSVVDSIYIYRS